MANFLRRWDISLKKIVSSKTSSYRYFAIKIPRTIYFLFTKQKWESCWVFVPCVGTVFSTFFSPHIERLAQSTATRNFSCVWTWTGFQDLVCTNQEQLSPSHNCPLSVLCLILIIENSTTLFNIGMCRILALNRSLIIETTNAKILSDIL